MRYQGIVRELALFRLTLRKLGPPVLRAPSVPLRAHPPAGGGVPGLPWRRGERPGPHLLRFSEVPCRFSAAGGCFSACPAMWRAPPASCCRCTVPPCWGSSGSSGSGICSTWRRCFWDSPSSWKITGPTFPRRRPVPGLCRRGVLPALRRPEPPCTLSHSAVLRDLRHALWGAVSPLLQPVLPQPGGAPRPAGPPLRPGGSSGGAPGVPGRLGLPPPRISLAGGVLPRTKPNRTLLRPFEGRSGCGLVVFEPVLSILAG